MAKSVTVNSKVSAARLTQETGLVPLTFKSAMLLQHQLLIIKYRQPLLRLDQEDQTHQTSTWMISSLEELSKEEELMVMHSTDTSTHSELLMELTLQSKVNFLSVLEERLLDAVDPSILEVILVKSVDI